MNRKLTFAGGEPTINFDDLDRNNKANLAALIASFRAFGDNYIIQGVTGATSITAGYIMLDGEIVQVDAHTKTSTHFVKVTTYDVNGDKTFNDATPRQTWQINRATITAGSGSLAYSGAKRLGDVIVDSINSEASVVSGDNLESASTSQQGVQENATATEAKALSSTTKTITPSTISDVTGGTLTKVIDIGDWDMVATPTLNLTHGLSDYKKIRAISIIIRNDADSDYYDLHRFQIATGIMDGGINIVNSTIIALQRRVTGVFDSVNFDSTSYNRGWATIQYSV